MTAAFVPSVAAWPPPPDLDSIRDLVRAADPEGLIAKGSPNDEYEPEEEAIFSGIKHFTTAELTSTMLLPIIEEVWHRSFSRGKEAASTSQLSLQALAEQIAHFFGPEAQPRTRHRD